MKGDTIMKKSFVKVLALALVAVMLVSSLVSCGKKLSGSYEAEIDFLGQKWNVTYTFSGSDVEVVSKVTVLGTVKSTPASGTYEIVENSDGTMEITFDFETETDLFKDGTFTFAEGEDYIKIGTSQYQKVEK